MTGMPATTRRVLASRSRLRILRLLRSADAAFDIADIAAEVDLHPNTAREHLQLLVDAGFVVTEVAHRASRGRPRMRYRAVERPAAATVDERLRARMIDLLLASYADIEPAGDAHDATDATPDETPGGFPEAARQLAMLELHFEDLGFDPEVTREPLDMHFFRCPMTSLATSDTALVCAVHEDLARGVLAQEDGPVEVESLHPFVEPRHCVLHLRERTDADGEPDAT